VALPYLTWAAVQPASQPMTASVGWFGVRNARRMAPLAIRQG